ncbi:hypothetical protein BGZ98_009227 [Dissophora globulifera]|nr:hypothetical protein BGZ98_009227 [Dissophora globulifera]
MASGEDRTFEKRAVVHGDSSSLIALAAEIAKHSEKSQRAKASGGFRVPRSLKKPTLWQRQNAGVGKRSQKHDAESQEDGDAARRAAMERKARLYEMLERGEDLPDQLRDEVLVEFEYKNRGRGSGRRDYDSDSDNDQRGSNLRKESFQERRQDYEAGRSRRRDRSTSSDLDRDESAALARHPKDFKGDPWVEHVDEFGRTRLMRQSEIPTSQPPADEYRNPGIHDPANPFPVFRNQDAIEKQEWIRDATGDIKRSTATGSGYSQANKVRHYDNTTERRARGVGFYAFSQDAEERAKQMQDLRELRSETEKKREQFRSLRDRRRDEIEARKRVIRQKRLKSLASTVSES